MEKPAEEPKKNKIKQNIAVFFDAENVTPKFVQSVYNIVRQDFNIVILRAYADWSLPNMKSWQNELSILPILPLQAFHQKNEREVVDKMIIMDAVQTATERTDITTFCIVSADKGYANLVLKLREIGKNVIGFGEREKLSDSSRFVQTFNEYNYCEDLVSPIQDSANDKELQSNQDILEFTLQEILRQAFDGTNKQPDDSVLMSQFGESVKRQIPDFTPKAYGYSSFRKMIEDFDDIFTIKLADDGSTNFVSLNEQEEIAKPMTGTIKRRIQNWGIIENELGDFFYYVGDIKPEFRDEKIQKGMNVEFVAVKLPDAEAQTSREKNGKATEIVIK